MDVFAIVNIEAKDGRSAEALEVIRRSQENCLSLDNCGGFDVYQNQKDIHRFHFVERWASVEEHKEFLSGLMSDPSFIASLEAFTSPPDIEYFDLK